LPLPDFYTPFDETSMEVCFSHWGILIYHLADPKVIHDWLNQNHLTKDFSSDRLNPFSHDMF